MYVWQLTKVVFWVIIIINCFTFSLNIGREHILLYLLILIAACAIREPHTLLLIMDVFIKVLFIIIFLFIVSGKSGNFIGIIFHSIDSVLTVTAIIIILIFLQGTCTMENQI